MLYQRKKRLANQEDDEDDEDLEISRRHRSMEKRTSSMEKN